VSLGRDFYGPGGPYENFAGRDATRGLACQSFDEEMLTKDLDGPLDDCNDLDKDQIENLNGWIERFDQKVRLDDTLGGLWQRADTLDNSISLLASSRLMIKRNWRFPTTPSRCSRALATESLPSHRTCRGVPGRLCQSIVLRTLHSVGELSGRQPSSAYTSSWKCYQRLLHQARK
jgi:hypothetical protein